MRVANCTTAAQYFHLLRRQAALLLTHPLPLIVLTPKSLLRHPAVASRPIDLAEGGWQPVIDDEARAGNRGDVRRLVYCSGKIAVDVFSHASRATATGVAVCRVEQLYPVPEDEMLEVLRGYPNVEEVAWVQEEPENMGAWEFLRPTLQTLAGRLPLTVVARPRSSSPAEGSATLHARIQEALVTRALTVDVKSTVTT
jgi:2-oxoglutarate dehydrogenase E1 component